MIVDLSLAKLPGKFVITNRKEGKKEWVTHLPRILRDLAPTSGFDPQEVWKREQEMEAEEKGDIRQKNARGRGSAKAEQIRATQQELRKTALFERDAQIIASKKETGDVE